MCDYSLMMASSRLAVEGEELVAHRFRSGSIGLLASREFDSWTEWQPCGFWQCVKANFVARPEPGPVVCVPPGARLRFTDVPESLQTSFHLHRSEEAIFTQLSADINQHRDAVCFPNGSALLLQVLPEGTRIKVLWLWSTEPEEALTPEFTWSEPLRTA